eukprot:scaffold1195_cov35-Phaeocystis_antarctica.AAC.2
MVASSSATLAFSSLSSVLYLILIGRAAPARPPRWAGRGAAGRGVAMRMAPCVGTAESGRGRAGSGGSAPHSSSSFLTTGPMPPRTTVRSPTNISMHSSSSICWV